MPRSKTKKYLGVPPKTAQEQWEAVLKVLYEESGLWGYAAMSLGGISSKTMIAEEQLVIVLEAIKSAKKVAFLRIDRTLGAVYFRVHRKKLKV